MGLLDRAGTIEEQGFPTIQNPVHLARKVLSENPVKTDGPDYPGYMFDVFVRVLNFGKAALMLMNDDASEFTPWLTRGFDRTTVRRLRVPVEFPGLKTSKAFFLSDAQKKSMEPLFSIREFGLNKNILFVGIGDGTLPTGIIIATGFADPAQSPESTINAASFLAESFSSGLTKSRTWIRTSAGNDDETFLEWLDARGEQKSILAIVDFSKAIQRLETKIPGIEPFQLRKDFLGILKNFTGRTGRLREMDFQQAAILFPWERLIDRDLFLHQLNHAFSTAFSQLDRNPEITAVFHEWPGERDSIMKSLPGYF